MSRISRIKSSNSYKSLQTARFLVITFTVLFILSGIFYLGAGIYAKTQLSHWIELLGGTTFSNAQVTPFLLIALGLFIFLTAVIGFISATKDNLCIINCYCLLLGVVCITEIIGGILAVVFIDDVKSALSQGLKREMDSYYPGSLMDRRQIELGCCGDRDFNDWFNTTWNKNQSENGCSKAIMVGTNFVPESCCSIFESSVNSTCPICTTESQIPKGMSGCSMKIFGNRGETLNYLFIIAFSCAALQVAGLLCTICLFRRLRTTMQSY